MDIRKQVEFLKTLSKEDLKRYNNAGDFLKEIQVKADKELLDELTMDNQKRIWIIVESNNLSNFKLNFNENPKQDIIKIYKKYFNCDLKNHTFHFILVKNLSVAQQMFPELTELPLFFETYNQEMHNPLFMSQISFK